MSDATSVLFGLEHEFSVFEVEPVDITTVKVIIEQTAREGAVSRLWGAQRHGEGPSGDAADGSPDRWADRGAVVAKAPPDLC